MSIYKFGLTTIPVATRTIATQMRRRLLEPMNTLTHFLGALAAMVGTILLIYLARHEGPKMVSLAVYGISMVILYATSTLFHGIKLPEDKRFWLNRLDHVAIFLLIAGTYTPIVFNLMSGPYRWALLVAVWMVALGGMAYKLFSRRIHGLFNASIYPVMSWAGVVPLLLASRVKPVLPVGGAVLLLLGGLVYMAGFVIYYRRRPDPWPDVFGHHEIWHLFVLGGSLFHFLFMVYYIVPASPA